MVEEECLKSILILIPTKFYIVDTWETVEAHEGLNIFVLKRLQKKKV